MELVPSERFDASKCPPNTDCYGRWKWWNFNAVEGSEENIEQGQELILS
ncbi:hypothetical protein GMD78_11295 [Ornithinibacillus sp. L9]|uniref:Uncharacterized protein n=1 Tax=Ornithinibacillus caprae TaxID=2678566 RepID=A0A6N8FNJ5_9BACI|nr:hypothetical protein [Ornithinibacillus caprae]MUK88958.1 hypothetical protein [Ornithinibacillus caprae]